MGLRMQAVIVNCQDPEPLAEFWAAALGWRITVRGDPEWGIEPPEGSREDCVVADMLFIRVPDEKQVVNRLHVDLRPEGPDGDQAAEVARLEALGATRADVGQGDDVSWVVMADPEGNELCVLAPYPADVQPRWQAQYDAYRPAGQPAPPG
ncbi:VOC family protein [Nocardioides islandensis]|uniref:VOC family protein n=1 Tax=Nocardioides islandensis TaxID=433663 RepID=A0A930VB76_9ACTN|nr:VOC family protein [Nocardioides islandensis]MBF4761645.1 VOC family protein [Nocardioides islandensis]